MAWVVVGIAFFSARTTMAQLYPPSPRWAYGNGFIYDPHYATLAERYDHKCAEHQLAHLESKIARDQACGNPAKNERRLLWMNELRFRLAADEWLIRMNSLQDPGYYPYRTDFQTAGYMADAARPGPEPGIPQAVLWPNSIAPETTIYIANTGSSEVGFNINGVSAQIFGGSRKLFPTFAPATITFNGGGSIGERRYTITPGRYEFRSTAEGWILVRTSAKP